MKSTDRTAAEQAFLDARKARLENNQGQKVVDIISDTQVNTWEKLKYSEMTRAQIIDEIESHNNAIYYLIDALRKLEGFANE